MYLQIFLEWNQFQWSTDIHSGFLEKLHQETVNFLETRGGKLLEIGSERK